MLVKLAYTDPRSKQTLREGIQEARAAEGDDDAVEKVAADLVADINAHDAIHVLFGCPTDLRGEILAHVWTLVGTDMQMKEMHRVNQHADHRATLAQIGHGHLFRTWLRSFPQIVATFHRAFRMKKRWEANNFEAHLDRPLTELRAELGIRLPASRPSKPGSGALVRRVSAR